MFAGQSEPFINQLKRTLTASQSFSARSHFRNILIVESRASWSVFIDSFDPALDIVLTYDFALLKQIEEVGGTVFYVDHLCEPSFMQENNFLTYEFFRDWHLDVKGADLFRYREVAFGFSFRVEIWNDFTFYVRNRLCLEQLRSLDWENIYLDERLPILGEVLGDMRIAFKTKGSVVKEATPFPGYFFPIHRWMNERLRIRLPRHVLRDLVVTVQGVVMSWLDRLSDRVQHKAGVFVQEYHPTRQLLQRLKQQPDIRVVQAHFSSAPGLMKFLKERPIPVYGSCKPYQNEAARLIGNFRQLRSARLVLSNGVDITEAAYRVIERKVVEVLPESLRALNCVIDYLDRHPLRLEILIANIGQVAMLVDCVAKSRGVPSYMIINGLLGSAYLDEAKYATIINSYSVSIRDNYFRGMNNVFCLGDPRMDDYAVSSKKPINRKIPTITIGASGYNPTDLNSFLAVEFEFLNDVLLAIRSVETCSSQFRLIIKVRPNGYINLYKNFVDEYFPGFVNLIVDDVAMREVLEQSDLFISIYSQTLFEASCLGIPVIYHKTDCEVMDSPFDGNSELVTTLNVDDLISAIRDFKKQSSRFDDFMDKKIMEKYVGPLDGGNLKRNFEFVVGLLEK